jgi:hypothetical protein
MRHPCVQRSAPRATRWSSAPQRNPQWTVAVVAKALADGTAGPVTGIGLHRIDPYEARRDNPSRNSDVQSSASRVIE